MFFKKSHHLLRSLKVLVAKYKKLHCTFKIWIKQAFYQAFWIPLEFNIDRMFTVTLRRLFDFERWVEPKNDIR